jgi:competence protein ComEA
MKGFGAVATDEEWKTIHTYILSNVAYLNVNRGTAEDFAAVFLIDAQAATDLVAYREKASGFKTIDDLKKAPGLDAARVEAAKDRISF